MTDFSLSCTVEKRLLAFNNEIDERFARIGTSGGVGVFVRTGVNVVVGSGVFIEKGVAVLLGDGIVCGLHETVMMQIRERKNR
jgi:uridine phosphorylase